MELVMSIEYVMYSICVSTQNALDLGRGMTARKEKLSVPSQLSLITGAEQKVF
jgi:hypothetical protein